MTDRFPQNDRQIAAKLDRISWENLKCNLKLTTIGSLLFRLRHDSIFSEDLKMQSTKKAEKL